MGMVYLWCSFTWALPGCIDDRFREDIASTVGESLEPINYVVTTAPVLCVRARARACVCVHARVFVGCDNLSHLTSCTSYEH